MQYGSGQYDIDRTYVGTPVPRVRPEASQIASKHRGVGMYTCLNQPQLSKFGQPSEYFWSLIISLLHLVQCYKCIFLYLFLIKLTVCSPTIKVYFKIFFLFIAILMQTFPKYKY